MSAMPPSRGLYIAQKSIDGKAARGYSFLASTFSLLTKPCSGSGNRAQSHAGHYATCPRSLGSSGGERQ